MSERLATRTRTADSPPLRRILTRVAAGIATLLVLGVLLWQAIAAGGVPNPTAPNTPLGSAVVDIGVLVFREGLECILVLAAITASMVGASQSYRRPIAAGVALAFLATLLTWRVAVAVVDSLTDNVSALHLQAITGLLAIVVLLVVMNWFFHKIYWSGWISLHTKRKRALVQGAEQDEGIGPRSTRRLVVGLVMLGFTSFYREGFEVVLFLQNYRLKLGGRPVLYGVAVGAALSAIVAALTFIANRRLPYKKMLVVTGVMLGIVLLVMVGEQAQEMQLAHWLPTTRIPWLERVLPEWLGLWLAVFPTVETLAAQLVAALLVLGSYFIVNVQLRRRRVAA
jgi:high-affinity iron transporter